MLHLEARASQAKQIKPTLSESMFQEAFIFMRSPPTHYTVFTRNFARPDTFSPELPMMLFLT